MGNDWALRTATPVRARAMDNDSVSAEAIVRVAEPGPLIATKLQALPNRASVKEATDLLDILRLTLDQHSGPLVRSQIAAADPRLKSDAALHVERWFLDRAASLAGWVGASVGKVSCSISTGLCSPTKDLLDSAEPFYRTMPLRFRIDIARVVAYPRHSNAAAEE
jgi:hypothetical protein